ncbi:MAG TPA: hypothetical protein DEF45_20390 [Rhodopirellula sp.]|nr:hypothetical protein [Rhodopirellula sp.]
MFELQKHTEAFPRLKGRRIFVVREESMGVNGFANTKVLKIQKRSAARSKCWRCAARQTHPRSTVPNP